MNPAPLTPPQRHGQPAVPGHGHASPWQPRPAGAAQSAPARTYHRAFPARPDQIREARVFLAAAIADCAVAADALLCLSELATNSVLHSASRESGGTFTVRAHVHHGDHVRIEVEDAGGPWKASIPDGDSRPHGLEIVRAIAADCGVTGSALAGRVAWARLDWPATPSATGLSGP
jgi:serine/threonine-protein kinase RsbW